MKRNTTLNDTARVEYIQAYMGGLLDAIRYTYYSNNLDAISLDYSKLGSS